MSEIVRVMCDQCGTTDNAKKSDFAFSVVLPDTWRAFERKHFCRYACVVDYCHDRMSSDSSSDDRVTL